MKRIYAGILLIPLIVLSIETVKVAEVCRTQEPAKCSLAAKMKGGCPINAKSPHKKDKTSSKSCIDCPLCYTFTFQSEFVFDLVKPVSRTEYSVMLVNNLSNYYSRHWKPPNQATL